MNDLKKIIKKMEKALKKAPLGVVNVHSTENRVQYYYKESSNDKVKKYMKESEKYLVKDLCQKDYNQRVFAAGQKELKALEKLQKVYKGQSVEDIYESMGFI